ncbi:MAG: hypothetical protein WC406_09860 [Methanoregula sp.]
MRVCCNRFPSTATKSKPATVISVPNLVGTWSGQMNGDVERTSNMKYPNYTVKLVVSGQNRRVGSLTEFFIVCGCAVFY